MHDMVEQSVEEAIGALDSLCATYKEHREESAIGMQLVKSQLEEKERENRSLKDRIESLRSVLENRKKENKRIMLGSVIVGMSIGAALTVLFLG